MKIVALCRVLVKTKKLSPFLAAKSDHVTSDEMAKNRADNIEQVCGVDVSQDRSIGSFPSMVSSSNAALNKAPGSVSSVREQELHRAK